MKVYINGQGHITKMASMAINSKTFKNLLHESQIGNCSKLTSYTAVKVHAVKF